MTTTYTMVAIGIGLVLVALGFALGYIIGEGMEQMKRKSATAFMVHFEDPHCHRCRTILKQPGVLYVPAFPGRGELYCRQCFEIIRAKAIQSWNISEGSN